LNISKLTDRINYRGYPSPLKILVVLATAIFVVEFTIMAFFIYWPLGDIPETVIDASLLTSIILPILYYIFYRPFLHYIRDLKSAED
jgi:hypothetical protein